MSKHHKFEISSQIDLNFIEKYGDDLEGCTYGLDTPLFYEGHVPVVAYIVLSGKVHVTKKKKVVKTLCAGSLIGIKLLLNHTPSIYTAVAEAKSKVLFLDRSTLLEVSDLHLGKELQRHS
jgi:CRP-like cAMP-binding protein